MARKTVRRPVEELDYEEAFKELQAIVDALEGEPESLDEAMGLFERGQALVQRCAKLLEQAELKVRQLSAGEPESPSEV